MEAVDAIIERGYIHDFQCEREVLYCPRIGSRYRPDELLITEVYRFEGISDPDDNSVVYAIVSTDGIKGLLIDAYGAYADESKNDFLKNIAVKKRENP